MPAGGGGAAVQAANAYNVALLNGGMGDASQLLHVDQSALVYNNLAVPLGTYRYFTSPLILLLAGAV